MSVTPKHEDYIVLALGPWTESMYGLLVHADDWEGSRLAKPFGQPFDESSAAGEPIAQAPVPAPQFEPGVQPAPTPSPAPQPVLPPESSPVSPPTPQPSVINHGGGARLHNAVTAYEKGSGPDVMGAPKPGNITMKVVQGST